MANNVATIAVVKPDANGGVHWAPVGTTVPTSASGTLATAFKNVGYISSDGVERADNAEAGEGKQAWGGDTVVSGTGKFAPSIKLKIWQMGDPNALAMAYHTSDITGTENNLSYKVSSKTPEDKALVLKMVRGDGVVQVVVMPHAAFQTRGDIKNDNDEVDGLEVTYDLRPDAQGNYAYIYIASTVGP